MGSRGREKVTVGVPIDGARAGLARGSLSWRPFGRAPRQATASGPALAPRSITTPSAPHQSPPSRIASCPGLLAPTLKWYAIPAPSLPSGTVPFSPVHSCRKFSAERGLTSGKSTASIRPCGVPLMATSRKTRGREALARRAARRAASVSCACLAASRAAARSTAVATAPEDQPRASEREPAGRARSSVRACFSQQVPVSWSPQPAAEWQYTYTLQAGRATQAAQQASIDSWAGRREGVEGRWGPRWGHAQW